MIKKIQRKVRSGILEKILDIKRFNPEDAIILFSEARGGSTWLMEMIASIPRTCINWEPFHDDSGVIPKEYHMGWIPYLPANDKNPKYLKLMNDILSFKISSPYTRKYLTIKETIRARTVITKFVRANLLLPYFLNNLKFNHPPIFLLRHPIDTCMSQLVAFKKNDKSFITDKIPDQINNDRYTENIDYIRNLDTQLEKKIVNWCLNNVPTLNRLDSFEKLIIVFYSDLLLDPKKEMERIFNQMNLDFNTTRTLNKLDFRQVSSTDFKNQFKDDPKVQLNKNFKKLDMELKNKIQNIFDHFDFKLYDAFSPLPKKGQL